MSTFADIDTMSVEDALGRYAQLTDENADLFALYANGAALWDAHRKQLWCALADSLRDRALTAGTKMTEAAIEQRAHADPEYQAFLFRSQQEKARYHVVEAERLRIEWLIQYRRAHSYRESAEARLG